MMPDPLVPPGPTSGTVPSAPVSSVAAPQPYAYAAPVGGYAPPPAARSGRNLSIIALVVASFAALCSLAAAVFAFLAFSTLGPMGPTEGEYIGTAPKAVEGQPYAGDQLAGEVARTLGDFGWEVEGLTCTDVPVLEIDAESTCTGTLDGASGTVLVLFDDGEGHFTMTIEE